MTAPGFIREPMPPPSRPNGAPPPPRSEPAAMRVADGNSAPNVWLPEGIIASWRAEGPLVHVPCGLPTVDELTGGGPVLGSRWYLIGAPDAGKTALLVQLLDHYAEAGLVVGFLAVDEEPGDIFTRLLQRRGWHRRECEEREEKNLELMAVGKALGCWRMYGSEHTIESAAEDLAAHAASKGARAALGIDSIQTVQCHAEFGGVDSVREAVTARTRSIRAMSSMHRMLVIATSEMNRNAYRSIDAAEQTNDLAAAKESGAIEYSARVMLALRSVKNETDLLEAKFAKNKHGPSGDAVYLRIDRARMRLEETEGPKAKAVADGDAVAKAKRAADAAAVAVFLSEGAGLMARALYPALAARHGSFSHDRAAAALARLGPALVKHPGKRNAEHHYVDGASVDAEVMSAIPSEKRAEVLAAQPPATAPKRAKKGTATQSTGGTVPVASAAAKRHGKREKKGLS